MTQPRVPAEPSSVVTATDEAIRLASSAPKSRSGVGRAEHEVDPAAPRLAAARRGRTAARCRSRRRRAWRSHCVARAAVNGRPSGPTTSTGVCCGCSRRATRCRRRGRRTRSRRSRRRPRGADAVDRERPAQDQRGVGAADRQGDELARPGVLGDARRDERSCGGRRRPVRLDEHGAAHLHRRCHPGRAASLRHLSSSSTVAAARPLLDRPYAERARGPAPRCPAPRPPSSCTVVMIGRSIATAAVRIS